MSLDMARAAIAILIVLGFLGSPTQAWAQVISQDEAVDALLVHGWRLSAAESITRKVPASLARLPQGMGGVYHSYCDNPSIEIDARLSTLRVRLIAHEYLHAWEHLNNNCSFDFVALRQDFPKLTFDFVFFIVAGGDHIHYNYALLANLNYNYSEIPEWYHKRYLSFARPRFIQGITAPDKRVTTYAPTPTPTPTPPISFRVLIPLGVRRV